MIITQASSKEELTQIAEDIKKKYSSKHIDCAEFTIHNPNNGMYDESLSFEPISKGNIAIAFTPLGHTELNMEKNQSIRVIDNK